MKEHETKAVFAEVHKAIREATDSTVDAIGADQAPALTYPPGIEISEEEKKAISDLKLTPEAQSALKKMITDTCGYQLDAAKHSLKEEVRAFLSRCYKIELMNEPDFREMCARIGTDFGTFGT